MSQEESGDQITKVPPEPQTPQPNKEKDPRKVAAGKKPAEYNKKAKAALKRENKREAIERENKREAAKTEGETIGSSIQMLSYV